MASIHFVTFLLLVAIGFLLPSGCWASACCARSSAAPTLILGEDQAQLSFGASVGNVVALADSEGAAIFGGPGKTDKTQTYRLEGALLLSDRYQVGGSFSLVQHQVAQNGSQDHSIGTGDTRMSAAYEFMPLWSYSKWKPQGFIFSVVTLPTGGSVYEAQSPFASDVTGNGFYSISIGSIFVKHWAFFDAFLMPEIHYSFPRTFQTSSNKFQVFPGFGGSIGFGVGVSPGGGNLRMGLRIQPRLDQPRAIPTLDSPFEGSLHVGNCDVGFDLSYLISASDTAMMSYVDQTLLGPAMNSNLTRNFSVNFQHRWER